MICSYHCHLHSFEITYHENELCHQWVGCRHWKERALRGIPEGPHFKIVGLDLLSRILKDWLLLDRYDANHWNAFPVMPTLFSNLWSKTLWLTVSNAADKSSIIRAVTCLHSMAMTMSFWILNSAVSVLLPSLYADWNFSKRFWLFMCSTSWKIASLSISLETKDGFEIGR